ncbi:flagellar brake protein [Streptomyces scopuliridis]|uniref:Flagellar brake protein n=1 Tax=Streptomyces scopuliridis TaxID=452529 RepID=A0ACD4ZKZ6_9ACTN|nr:hypothetical protein [Streptomyces scopuliridis]WSB34590.1 flagellar brake protein [Streptomyces scopuliridis]WSB98835.1 flagellar brake protein [Streptomyces scopuliridis]WSC07461.1 flagellar brake protein [Streptomyces scopuliridis]
MTDPIGDVPSEPPSEEPQDGTAEAGGETHDLSDDDADEQAARIRRLREAGLSMTHQGARILGRSFISAGAVGYGSGDSAETINNYYGTAPEPDPDDGRVAEQQLEDLRKFYVRPPSHTRLRDLLHAQGLAVLRGAPGSGRFTTALLAAQEARDTGVVVLDPEAGLRRLMQQGQSQGLEVGRAHVVEGDDTSWAPRLRGQFLDRLREETYLSPLVIVVDEHVLIEVSGLRNYLVPHEPPPSDQVLGKHLEVMLADRPEAARRKLLEHESVREELLGLKRMTDVAEFAVRLEVNERSGHDADAIVLGFKTHLRTRAEKLLGPPAGVGTDAKEVSLWSRAFLLACVVLDGMSLTRVSRESQRLAELLHGVAQPSSLPAMPLFDESLRDWRRHADVEFTDREGRVVDAQHPECRVRVRQQGLREAVLQVLWHDHSGARGPLLDWLDGLVVRSEEAIRVAAAQTAGLLATFDWVYVEEELLDRWATDTGEHAPKLRFAAAWALERAVADDRLAVRIRRLLRRWAGQRSHQICAEAAYGTRIGARFPTESLNGLEEIAKSRKKSVRDAVREIYAAGSAPQVLERLAGWAASPYSLLREDAAMCLQQLSGFHGTPAVTSLLHEPGSREHLLALTRLVLVSKNPLTRRRGWDTVRRWVSRAGDELGLAEVLAEFLVMLPPDVDTPADGLRERILFHLRLWAHQGRGGDAAARISSLVTERWSI